MSEQDSATSTGLSKSKRSYAILALVVLVGFAGFMLYQHLTAHLVSTDDAQLESDVVPVAAKVGGTILHLYVEDNQFVTKGTLLAEIDARDYQARIAQLQAELDAAKAQAETRSAVAAPKHPAAIAAAKAGVAKAGADLRKASLDLGRASDLKRQNAISDAEFEDAKSNKERFEAAYRQADAQLRLAEDQLGFAEAKVKSAEAALNQALLQLEYTKVVAPRDGTLSKIAVEEGQLLQPGQLIAQLVDPQMFVVANFKETQIGKMSVGQEAEITLDSYPGLSLSGKVESVAAATGARFSLLPPDNASGNFVKVVQRVPVKIKLERLANPDLVLRAGLSAEVSVNVMPR